MKLPPFIGMAFNQLFSDICPWLGSGVHPLQLSCPAHTFLPIPFNFVPPRFHCCINTISLVRKGTFAGSLSLLFLIDYAEQPLLHSPRTPYIFEFQRAGLMPTDPSPFLQLPPPDLKGGSPTYKSSTSTPRCTGNPQSKK